MKKLEWLAEGSKYESCFQKIAKQLGKEHEITKMLGSLAWGRHHWELTGTAPGLESSIRRASALAGYFQAINTWAGLHDSTAQRTILDIWQALQHSSPQAP